MIHICRERGQCNKNMEILWSCLLLALLPSTLAHQTKDTTWSQPNLCYASLSQPPFLLTSPHLLIANFQDFIFNLNINSFFTFHACQNQSMMFWWSFGFFTFYTDWFHMFPRLISSRTWNFSLLFINVHSFNWKHVSVVK